MPHIRRQHRRAALPALAGTCLAFGITRLAVVDEAVLSGTRTRAQLRPFSFILTCSGRKRVEVSGPRLRSLQLDPGSLLIHAAVTTAGTIIGNTPHHAIYCSLSGPWAQRLTADLAAHDGILFVAHPPASVVATLRQLVDRTLDQSPAWDWEVVQALGRLAVHCHAMSTEDHSLVERLTRLVDDAPEEPWRLDDVAAACGLSPAACNHRLRAELGEGPASWIRRRRFQHACRLLAAGMSPSEVAATFAFPSLAQFSRAFKATVGCPPSRYVARPS